MTENCTCDHPVKHGPMKVVQKTDLKFVFVATCKEHGSFGRVFYIDQESYKLDDISDKAFQKFQADGCPGSDGESYGAVLR